MPLPIAILAAVLPAGLLALFAGTGLWVMNGRAEHAADLRASITAFLQGDCPAAIELFESGTAEMAIGSPPAPGEPHRAATEQCRTLLRVKGSPAERLRGYAELSPSIARTPGWAALRTQVADVLESSRELARRPSRSTCQALVGLRADAVLPVPQGDVAGLLVACGKLLGRSGRVEQEYDALQLYRDVRTAQPRPRAAAAAVEAEALLRAKRARAAGVERDLYEPDRRGTGRSSRLTVLNDTPTTLYVALYNGRVSRVVEVPPCRGCTPRPADGDDCRASAGRRTLTLPRGTYTASWELVQRGRSYRLAVARWDLRKGGRYTDCHRPAGR